VTPTAGRVLAVDLGERRTGVALSDELGILASPLCILRVRTRDRVEAVAEIVHRHSVAEIVVGFPRTLRGEIGPQARRVDRFVEELRRAVDAPVRTWDEQYSTAEAVARLAATQQKPVRRGSSPARRGRADGYDVDALAAAVILQEYLDWRRSSSS
jgi:putative holliday junction resolvase